MTSSKYRAVWLFAMFDVPVDSSLARKQYARFRAALLREGFMMLQFSVYARYFSSEESASAYRRRLRESIPARGQVRFLAVTDRQFGRMEVHYGKSIQAAEGRPAQMLLF